MALLELDDVGFRYPDGAVGLGRLLFRHRARQPQCADRRQRLGQDDAVPALQRAVATAVGDRAIRRQSARLQSRRTARAGVRASDWFSRIPTTSFSRRASPRTSRSARSTSASINAPSASASKLRSPQSVWPLTPTRRCTTFRSARKSASASPACWPWSPSCWCLMSRWPDSTSACAASCFRCSTVCTGARHYVAVGDARYRFRPIAGRSAFT